jgi:hypothetical protein
MESRGGLKSPTKLELDDEAASVDKTCCYKILVFFPVSRVARVESWPPSRNYLKNNFVTSITILLTRIGSFRKFASAFIPEHP